MFSRQKQLLQNLQQLNHAAIHLPHKYFLYVWKWLIYLARTILPSDQYKFIVSDFSAIEARVLAHLAGEAWRSKVFAEGKDIYCASASQMFISS